MPKYTLWPRNVRIKPLNIAVIDLEAPSFKENDKFYMAGFYDGKDYIPFYNLDDLMEFILKQEFEHTKILAHFGGGYDFLFIADWLRKKEIEYTVIASGSRVIQIEVFQDIINHDGDIVGEYIVTFWDSFSLMPSGLDKLGKLFLGKGKAKIDISNFAKLSHKKQLEYNSQDCVLLFDIFKKFEQGINTIGGNVKVTLASTALDIFTRNYLLKKMVSDSDDYEFVQQSYKGGRVEIFRFDYSGKDYYYDYNSFYPWAMTKPVPYGQANKNFNPTVADSLLYCENIDSYFAVMECRVRIKDCYIPPIPFTYDGKLLFPTGTFTGVFTNLELALLYKYDLGEIISCQQIFWWQVKPILKGYAEDLYLRRKNSENETERYILKLLLNSLYGKFGSSPYKEIVKFGMSQINDINNCIELVPEKGIFLEKEYRYSPCTKVEMASCITARCRAKLFEDLYNISNKGRVYYCDTDSLITDIQQDESRELGELKLEAIIDRMQIILPKLYRIHLEQGDDIIKAKGFRKVNKAEFENIIFEHAQEFRHFRKFREMIRKNEGVKTDLRFKRLRSVYDKRIIEGHDTRPIKLEL
jgi:hypothetical protein